MKVPMKVDYGVRALVELALHYGEGPVQTADIAYKQGIPEAYLDRLMTTLNKFGFVLSLRGPQGGHRLASDPMDIDLGMVMKTLDGSSSPLAAAFNSPSFAGARKFTLSSTVTAVWPGLRRVSHARWNA